MTEDNLELRLTCGACPEQYDAFCAGAKVGYLRLRAGQFSVHCPDEGGEGVYFDDTVGDGRFEDFERPFQLAAAKLEILRWMERQGK